MRKVINTAGYGTSEGHAVQITLPNGKYFYTSVGSVNTLRAESMALDQKTVRYFGACIAPNINDRAHRGHPVQIDEVSVADFIDQIATEDECSVFLGS